MAPSRYELAPIFGARPTGVAFDVLERLGTPQVSEAARRLALLEREAEVAAEAALARLREEVPDRTLQQFLKRKLKKRIEIPADKQMPWLDGYDRAVRAARGSATELEDLVWREYERVQADLLREGARELPDFLAIESEGFADDLERMVETAASTAGHGNSDRRKLDRTLALYLQRVCAKNDSLSRFGPYAWGTVVPGEAVRIQPLPGIVQRRVEIERWVVIGLVAQMNADADVRPEACPRLHPHGCFEGSELHRLDEDRVIVLTAKEAAIVARCDGLVPAHQLGDLALLAELAERGVLRWELERLAIDVSPLASLQADVERWRGGPARERWRAILDEIAELARRFEVDVTAAGRRQIIAELRTRLESLEVEKRGDRLRTLYAARNPINENCLQAATITLGARTIQAVVDDATPWFELFRDAAAFAAARAFHQLHAIIAEAPRHGGKLRYSTLARLAQAHGLPSIENGSWHVRSGAETFEVIKRDFAEVLAGRLDAPEWQLTADDCAVLRRRHQFPPVGELSHASADLQISAASAEEAEAGRVEWIIAELHFGPTLVQHASYWGCPDKPALHAALARLMENKPFCVRDCFFDAPVHTCGEAAMAAMPHATYVGAGRPKPGWRTVRPADAEVVVDEEHCDVRLRAGGEDLGSMIRTLRLLSGLHPFFPLERDGHTPRLRVGNVVVQRQSWHLESDAIGERPHGVSAAFISRLERERATRGIPRRVYVRPVPGRLTGTWAARDKDNKPIYVDLESVMFLDILERRLRKYGALVLTEMSPSPEQLLWRLPSGGFTFELRTNVVPRE